MSKASQKQPKYESRRKAVDKFALAIVFLVPWLLNLADPSLFAKINSGSSDALFSARYAIRGRAPISPYIVNVVFDNESLDLLVPAISEREMYARLIHAVSESGAKMIACDIVFAGTSTSGGDDSLEKVIRDAGNVYLPLVPYARIANQKNSTSGISPKVGKPQLTSQWQIKTESGGSPPLANGFLSSFEALGRNAAASAHIACDPDPDGVNRRFPLFYQFSESLVPALPLVAACAYLSVAPERVKVLWGRNVILEGAIFPGGRTANVKIPIDGSGHVNINYVASQENSFYTISAKDLLSTPRGEQAIKLTLRDVLEGSLVFISDVSARNKDIGPDVFGNIVSYSEILLSIANSILTENFLSSSPPFLLPVILFSLLVFLLSSYYLAHTWSKLCAPIAAILLYFLIAALLFSFSGTILPTAIPTNCTLFFFIAVAATIAFRNERRATVIQEDLRQAKNELLRLEQDKTGNTEETHALGILSRQDSENRIVPSRADPPISADVELNIEDSDQIAKGLKSPEAFEGIVTRNRKMIGIFREIEAYRSSDTPILIVGETGTGKELIAHAIHRASGRKGKHVAVNVAGINDELFNDTLFGHKRGAYTGAERDEVGFVEVAEGGTLFLDEIGDLSKVSQIKLLRLIENKEYYPLNSKTLMKADVRIIAATNSDIDTKVRDNAFRDDLARRLGLRIAIPPLRERSDDIELLLSSFIKKSAVKASKETPIYSRELVELLKSYRFPGNIRELESMVEEAISKSESRELPLSVFNARMTREMKAGEAISISSESVRKSFAFAGDLLGLLKEIETSFITDAMRASKGNRRKAAKLLGISYDWLKRRVRD